MKRIVIFISLASIIFVSCSFIVPRRIKKEFKYCFTGEKTGLDTLININGYYAPSPDGIIQWNGRILTKDTLNPNYLFYDNGFVTNMIDSRYLLENNKVSSMKRRNLFDGDPGGYVLHGDTIKMQFIESPAIRTRGMWEVWFKIIDKNTIERIDTKDSPLHPASERIYIFRPLEVRPNPEDSWIYNKSWFRCK